MKAESTIADKRAVVAEGECAIPQGYVLAEVSHVRHFCPHCDRLCITFRGSNMSDGSYVRIALDRKSAETLIEALQAACQSKG
jgi:hypothetical protein